MGTLRCVEPFAFSDHKAGVERVVRAGDLVDAKDPLVKGREGWFETVEANVERVTNRNYEQATAAPGEKRAASVPSEPPRSGAGSGRDVWAEYAAAKGVEVTDDMTRDDIVAAVDG